MATDVPLTFKDLLLRGRLLENTVELELVWLCPVLELHRHSAVSIQPCAVVVITYGNQACMKITADVQILTALFRTAGNICWSDWPNAPDLLLPDPAHPLLPLFC